jgi:hypothetical protein
MNTLKISLLVIGASLSAMAAPVLAQTWTTYQAPGSPFTELTGPNGWNGTTYQAPASPFTETTIRGPRGQTRQCTTYQAPGSPFAETSCH